MNKTTVVTITDSNFIIPVFILILSLKYHKVKANIKILAINLKETEKQLFSQFENVSVFDANTKIERHPATRKAEAILLAENDDVDTITLLDGDCIVSGDITPFISVEYNTLSARIKSHYEDTGNFINHYGKNEEKGVIPKKILAIWKNDVQEKSNPSITNTVASGNLSICIKQTDFIRKWDMQMLKVLQYNKINNRFMSHDFSSIAYSQIDESVLNSLLAFAENTPKIEKGKLDNIEQAHVIHLGPHPKYWKLWPLNKLKYYKAIIELLEWCKTNGYNLPHLTWTLKKQNKLPVYWFAYLYEIPNILRKKARKIKRHLEILIYRH